MTEHKRFWKKSRQAYRILIMVCVFAVIAAIVGISFFSEGNLENPTEYSKITEEDDVNKIVDGIHVPTGFVEAEGLMTVVNNCTTCHSAQLVIQNRMNKERWISTIRWMQKTQNLWELGKNEEIIIDYLVTNYPPQKKGRREALTNVEWYMLKD